MNAPWMRLGAVYNNFMHGMTFSCSLVNFGNNKDDFGIKVHGGETFWIGFMFDVKECFDGAEVRVE